MAGRGAKLTIDYSELSKLSTDWHAIAQRMRGDSPLALKVARQSAAIITGHIRREVLTNVSESDVSVRTGGLARSFRDFAKATSSGLTFGSVSDLMYAGVQDQGQTIYPRTVKMLAVPLNRMAVGKWPRHFPKGTLFRVGDALARRIGKGKNAKLEFLFALKRSVRIPPKYYIRRAYDKAIPEVVTLLVKRLTEGL